jgi:hypothetical protein
MVVMRIIAGMVAVGAFPNAAIPVEWFKVRGEQHD